MDLKVNVEHVAEAAVVHIEGEVDLYSSKKVREEIMRLTDARTRIIVIDLASVKYMDSSGVATLIEGLQQSRKYDGRFSLAALQPNVREVFELTRLDRVFEIHIDWKSALENPTP